MNGRAGSAHIENRLALSRWGSSCYGDIKDGDQLKSFDGEVYTVQLFAGSLIDMDGWVDKTASTSTNLTLECSSNCPKAGITQADLDSQWTATPTLYLDGAVTYTFDAATKTLTYEDGGTKTVGFGPASDIQWGWISVSLTDNSGASPVSYMYQMSTDNKPAIAFDASNQQFVPAEPIVFADETFDPAMHARENSLSDDTMTMLYDAAPSWDDGKLKLENGYLYIDWFQSDIVDQWGYKRYVPKLTLKPGVALTVEGDPDGNGPIHDGQKIKFAPLFSEEFPQQRDEADCNADLHAAVDGMNDETMPLPAELPDDGNNFKAKIGDAPPGSFQVASIEGEIVIEKKEQE